MEIWWFPVSGWMSHWTRLRSCLCLKSASSAEHAGDHTPITCLIGASINRPDAFRTSHNSHIGHLNELESTMPRQPKTSYLEANLQAAISDWKTGIFKSKQAAADAHQVRLARDNRAHPFY